jgi:hypothetical protein
LIKTLLGNVRSLAGPLPTISNMVPTPETADAVFAAIAAHRSAHEEYSKAVTAAYVRPSCRTEKRSARIVVGLKDGTESSWTDTDGGGFSLVVTPTGRKETVYASSLAKIRENVPKELKGDARRAWIADRDAELEAAEQHIAKRWARTKTGKLEAALDEANNVERERMWDLIWTTPTTTDGLVALLSYSRESGGISELVGRDEWADALEWTIESAVCAIAGLPAPPMNKIVAGLREEASEEEVADA